MSEIINKVDDLLAWLKRIDDEALKTSKNSFISPKIEVRESKDSFRGLYAVDQINRREKLIRIPPSYLLNKITAICHITKFNEEVKLKETHFTSITVPQTDPDEFTKLYSKFSLSMLLALSSFQLLSLFICIEKQRGQRSFWHPFFGTLPEMSDFRLLPLYWEVLKVEKYQNLLSLLPGPVRTQANKVHERFLSDYRTVNTFIANNISDLDLKDGSIIKDKLPVELFLWAWLCINSRCLYMKINESNKADDSFTMVPYVDFLNHSCDDHCTLKVDGSGFQVFTGSGYSPNEQLFLSYGPHSNEFLLCEYGFILSENKWNFLDISGYIISRFTPNQIEFLKEVGYYDEYTLNLASGASFRTEVALAVLQESFPQKSRNINALINGYSDGKVYQSGSNSILKKILESLIFECEAHINLEYSDTDGSILNERLKMIGRLYYDMKQIANKTLQDL
ncbi:uncharacterized protein PRCAT00000764001 [Priceomyces carsonii]|uniref:uncharacterized protein n=1 Tax=Priceomyces carsonii TaxID=28549 RepID=UPI002ED9FAF6|nr:unnamed protein product [Priceomyces carsonii]